MMDALQLDALLQTALREDIGTGDITTLGTIPEGNLAQGHFIAKQAGVVCGLSVCARVFALLDSGVTFTPLVADGAQVTPGQRMACVEGPARAILTGERTALNFLQRLSGIATFTSACVAAVSGTNAHVCDTRKTTPGLRALEKYAVRTGGGSNHRFNLSDGILIKDNHIRAAGGIRAAVEAVRRLAPHTLKIEVETESFDMVREALACRADIIMLDNMSLEQMREAVRIVDGRALVEASGNMADKDLRAVADTGVDLISIGALTHTVRALDISLRF